MGRATCMEFHWPTSDAESRALGRTMTNTSRRTQCPFLTRVRTKHWGRSHFHYPPPPNCIILFRSTSLLPQLSRCFCCLSGAVPDNCLRTPHSSFSIGHELRAMAYWLHRARTFSTCRYSAPSPKDAPHGRRMPKDLTRPQQAPHNSPKT